MVSKGRSAPRTPAHLTPSEIERALVKLARRERDLNAFDVNVVEDYGSPEAKALCDEFNATVVDIFGADSLEAETYSLGSSLYRGAMVMRSQFSNQRTEVARYRDGYAKGVESALGKLATMKKLLTERLEDAGYAPSEGPPPAVGGLELENAIGEAAGKLFDNGHYAEAVENGCKALVALLRARTGRPDLDGKPLMEFAFSMHKPVLRVADLSSESGRNEQQGVMLMASGAMLALRNPRAHEILIDERVPALEYLATLSMLARIARAATKVD
jgi:uncharacterized protein (TIGR02391 family)